MLLWLKMVVLQHVFALSCKWTISHKFLTLFFSVLGPASSSLCISSLFLFNPLLSSSSLSPPSSSVFCCSVCINVPSSASISSWSFVLGSVEFTGPASSPSGTAEGCSSWWLGGGLSLRATSCECSAPRSCRVSQIKQSASGEQNSFLVTTV